MSCFQWALFYASRCVKRASTRGPDVLWHTLYFLFWAQHVRCFFPFIKGRELHYRVLENSFSNPNGKVNMACLEWMVEAVRSVDRGTHLDLLELYCGGGNHTCCLAPLFNRVFAVEIDSALCEAADFNLKLNSCENVYVCRAPSEKFCKQLSRTWRCCIHWAQKQGNDMSGQADPLFGFAVVDPPRAGLDSDTIKAIVQIEHILYVSCCVESLARDLHVLLETHSVQRIAVMDQFAYTKHVESAVLLVRRPSELD